MKHLSQQTRSPRQARAILLGVTICLLIGIAGIYSLSRSRAASTYDPTSEAMPHLLGYLWSDSIGGDKTSWQSNNASGVVTDRFEAVARALQATSFSSAAVTRVDPTKVTINNMPLSVPLDRLPAAIQAALDSNDKPALIAFATSVIEGEGNVNGMILDDPSAAHRSAFVSVMTALGVRTGPDALKPGQGIDALEADWPIVQCWPFAAYGRVPGGKPAAGVCDAPADTTPPTINLTAPAGALSVTIGDTVGLAASANDNIAVDHVEFTDNGSIIKTDSAPPYTATLNTTGLSIGVHTIKAKAYDAAGNMASSSSVAVTIVNIAPPLSPGDTNGDSRINAIDLSVLLSHDGLNFAAADFNNDGVVGAADLAILLGHWTW